MRRLSTALAAAALAFGIPACGTDDAAERDAKDAAEEVDKGVGTLDEEATDAGEDAAREAEKAAEDVDGK